MASRNVGCAGSGGDRRATGPPSWSVAIQSGAKPCRRRMAWRASILPEICATDRPATLWRRMKMPPTERRSTSAVISASVLKPTIRCWPRAAIRWGSARWTVRRSHWKPSSTSSGVVIAAQAAAIVAPAMRRDGLCEDRLHAGQREGRQDERHAKYQRANQGPWSGFRQCGIADVPAEPHLARGAENERRAGTQPEPWWPTGCATPVIFGVVHGISFLIVPPPIRARSRAAAPRWCRRRSERRGHRDSIFPPGRR